MTPEEVCVFKASSDPWAPEPSGSPGGPGQSVSPTPAAGQGPVIKSSAVKETTSALDKRSLPTSRSLGISSEFCTSKCQGSKDSEQPWEGCVDTIHVRGGPQLCTALTSGPGPPALHRPYLRAWTPTRIPLSAFPTLVFRDRVTLLRRLLVVLLLRIVWNSFPDKTIDKLGRSQKESREGTWDCWTRGSWRPGAGSRHPGRWEAEEWRLSLCPSHWLEGGLSTGLTVQWASAPPAGGPMLV